MGWGRFAFWSNAGVTKKLSSVRLEDTVGGREYWGGGRTVWRMEAVRALGVDTGIWVPIPGGSG